MGANVSLYGYSFEPNKPNEHDKLEQIRNIVLKEIQDMGWWNFNTVQLGKNINEKINNNEIIKIKKMTLTCITPYSYYTGLTPSSDSHIILSCCNVSKTRPFFLILYWEN